MRFEAAAALATAALLLAGCAESRTQNPLSPPTNGGVMPGGFSQPAPPGALEGTLIATLATGPLGAQIDESDKAAAYQAEYNALQFGRPGMSVPWKGSNPSHNGEVTPGPSYKVNAYDCRDYSLVVRIGSQSASARGTACKEANGAWRPVS